MTASACEHCHDTVDKGAYVCRGCERDLAKDLRRTAQVAGEALATITRQASLDEHHRRNHDPEPSLPFSWEAADATWAAAHTLTVWARHIATHRPDTPRPAVPTDQHPQAYVALWILDHLPWLRRQPEAAQAFDELNYACRLSVSTVDRPPARWYAGPCDGCTLDLYALPGARSFRCHECGAEYDAEQRRSWLLQAARDHLGPANQIAAALTALGVQVRVGTVYSWASRGRLIAHGHDAKGRPLYRVGDALDLVEHATRPAA